VSRFEGSVSDFQMTGNGAVLRIEEGQPADE